MFEGFVQPLGWSRGRAPTVSDGFHLRSNGVFHYGADLDYHRASDEPVGLPFGTPSYYTPEGTVALAAGPGIVTISKDVGTGGYVQIDHGGGIVTQYMHLDPRTVSVGQTVNAGDAVGVVGNNPEDSGDLNHLHFELIIDGTKVDPEEYIYGWPVVDPPSNIGRWIIYGAAAFLAYQLFAG